MLFMHLFVSVFRDGNIFGTGGNDGAGIGLSILRRPAPDGRQ